MPRAPLVPPELLDGPFTVAQAAAHGVTRRMLESTPVWRRLLTGVYVHRSVPDEPELRRGALRLVLPPGCAAGGLTAAWGHGLWTPRTWSPAPLVRTRPLGRAELRRAGVTGRRQRLEGDLVEVGGLLLTSPLRTAFDLMRGVPIVEGVTVADAVTSHARGLRPWDLAEFVERHRRWPGVEQARLALRLSSRWVRSPGETRLRMVVVLPGLPEPLVNPPVLIVTPQGRVLRYPDLLMVVRRPAVLEYDGAAYHDDEEKHQDDSERENLFVAHSSFPVLRFRKRQLRAGIHQTLDEIARTCGVEPQHPLDLRDFAAPRRRPRW
jgi:hypothetical protein